MELCREQREVEFRKEKFEISFHFYKCVDSGEQFTTTKLDELNLNQLHNEYRYKNNIPFVDEIIEIREKYGVAASVMSEILGFGVNTYRNYEGGEIPSKANAKLISLASNPNQFKELVLSATTLKDSARERILKRVDHSISISEKELSEEAVRSYLFGNVNRGRYSGFKKTDPDKFIQMVMFFAEKMRPFKTKMNKLLFYADFLHFRKEISSISGMRYIAIDYGPVPDNFQSIFEYIYNKGLIEQVCQEFSFGVRGTTFASSALYKFDDRLFTDTEIETLNHVVELFKDVSSSNITEVSHLEEAWIRNEGNKAAISYEYAFELNTV